MKTGDLIELSVNKSKYGLLKRDVGEIRNISFESEVINATFASKDGKGTLDVILEFHEFEIYEESEYSKEEQNVMHKFLMEKLEEIFNNLDNFKIKDHVDEKGIDSLIQQSAKYAATSGAIFGAMGPISLLGLPVDIINNITQQFRVTLGVIYDKTGKYVVSFNSFIRIVAISLGIEVGATVGKIVLIQISKQILLRIGAGGIGRLIPVFGAAIGGGVNYGFIISIGKSLKEMRFE